MSTFTCQVAADYTAARCKRKVLQPIQFHWLDKSFFLTTHENGQHASPCYILFIMPFYMLSTAIEFTQRIKKFSKQQKNSHFKLFTSCDNAGRLDATGRLE